jgi:hypothetical protein
MTDLMPAAGALKKDCFWHGADLSHTSAVAG